MKKWLVFLLAMLVLAGSLIPCCPADNCQEEQSYSAVYNGQQRENKDHPTEDSETGTCSPFFTCGTCVGFTQLTNQLVITVQPITIPVHEARLTPSFTSSYYANFFQPPRHA